MELRRVTIHGDEIAYRQAGEGPVVVLIHGMAGSSSTWRDVMPDLAADHTVVAPDLLGSGRSSKPATGDYSLGAAATLLRDLMVALGIERATIVGQSLGGGIAMQFAYQYPERCERLVLVGSGGLGREVSPFVRLFAFPGSEYLLPLVFTSVARDAGRWVAGSLERIGLRTDPQLTEVRHTCEALTDSETRAAFIRTLRAVVGTQGQQVSAAERLHLTEGMPTLIVWGDRDPIIPVKHGYAAHEAMPNSRLEIFEGVGHFPHCEAPARFAGVLRGFIASTAPAVGLQPTATLVRSSARTTSPSNSDEASALHSSPEPGATAGTQCVSTNVDTPPRAAV